MKKYVIFGDTHFAERLFEHIRQENEDTVLAFTQESAFIEKKELCGLPVIPFERLTDEIKTSFSILIAIGYSGMNNLRARIFKLCKDAGFEIGSYISKNAIVYSPVGEGCLVFPGTMIGTNVKTGVCNIFEPCVLMGHDNVIGDFNFFAGRSTFGGYVKIGSNCFVGMTTTVRNDVEIADYTLIGQSSNVLKSIGCRGRVFVGNPARQLIDKESEKIKI